MKFTIESATKDIFGLWEIDVTINGKQYQYNLSSQYAYNLAMLHYRAGRHTNCLAILNKHKV